MGGLWLTGCGAPAAPQPPTLNLPQPVRDLSATRVGDTVHVTFSVPEKTTDKLPLHGGLTVRLCRSVEAEPCQAAATATLPAPSRQQQQKTSSVDDDLPADLAQGPPRLLTYRVSLLNSGGKAAAESNPAFAVAGGAPSPVAGFAATPQRHGIVLAWQRAEVPAGATRWVRFDRTRTGGTAALPQPQNHNLHDLQEGKTQEEPPEQSLRIAETSAEPRAIAIDATARTGCSYRYTAQRVEQLTVAGHLVELSSSASAPVNVEYRDVFPPPPPVGLIAVVDTQAKEIDLSWTPDQDPALAGYVVYRRPAGGSETAARLSPTGKPVTASAWSDTSPIPGQRYAYSVSAIDLSGNESKRSAEVEETLTATTPQP